MADALRFGIFVPPQHRTGQSPTVLLEQDLQLIEEADRFGFDEAWVGEHRSAGWEIIGAPETFLAAAASRTSRIKLATGVTALPYQHPFVVADRAVLLDHLTRGRFILGTGPGGSPVDAQMIGIEPRNQRRMQEESLEAILALLESEEPVTRKTDWFELHDARLHLRPYSTPRFEVATTALASPSGPSLAGRFGLSLFSIGATTQDGFDFLGRTWEIAERAAAESGHVLDPATWRLTAPIHIAETEREAREQAKAGLLAWMDGYWPIIPNLALALPDGLSADERIDAVNAYGLGVIGTPEMAIAKIAELREAAPDFGVFLISQYDWAGPRATRESLQLFAREVAPAFQGQLDRQLRGYRSVRDRMDSVRETAAEARAGAVRGYESAPAARG
ncbi:MULTISPECIES: LLM class flavin-dependent oxidoreductase [unclassified Streptomyces]|uniref:LLM class flavin-dependent oxidoreductase n=1 Tax=unclassified Streptomyces TaxID=2593676 RepID=UPI002E2E61B4|nr:LLM class flavin-dependent oxidoreductase [Streptomyces sp. NBC_00223]